MWRNRAVRKFLALVYYCIFSETMEYRSSKARLNAYKEYKLNEIEKDSNYCHPMRKHEKEYLDEEAEKVRSEKLYYWSGWNIYDW